MAKSENQKVKTLYVAKYFLENSDENHAVTAGDVVDYLKNECGIEAERRAIYRDIAALRDVFGMDIEGGQGGKYRLLSRQFEFDDLRLLAECVHAAKFISARQAKDLVDTLGEFCSTYQAEQLQQEVFLCDRVKTTQKGTMAIISKINQAMATRQDGKPHTPQKISFKYLKYTLQDGITQVERRKGAIYKVSPYKLLINDGNYYLLGYGPAGNRKAPQIATYRVDRMKEASVYKGYKRDKIEMRGDRAEMSDFPLYLNMVAGGLDCRNQAIGGFSFVVKIYALPVVKIIGQFLYLLGRYGFDAQIGYGF